MGGRGILLPESNQRWAVGEFYTPSPTNGGFSLPTVRGNPIGLTRGVSSTVPFADTVTESYSDTAGSEPICRPLYIHNAYVDPTNGSPFNIEGSDPGNATTVAQSDLFSVGSATPASVLSQAVAAVGSATPASVQSQTVALAQRSLSEPPRPLAKNAQQNTFERLLRKFRETRSFPPSLSSTVPFADTVASNRL